MHSTQQGSSYNDASPVLSLTVAEFRELVAQAVRLEEPVDVEMAGRWDRGQLILKPGREDLQEKAIPIEMFFHKIVMLRDRLRVLEQKINSHPKLTDEDKIEMQQYVTRIHGSLTTFNVLFQHRDEQFRGEGRTG
jgi:hypothetical protein